MSAARRKSRKTAVDTATTSAQHEDRSCQDTISEDRSVASEPFGPVDVFTPNSWASRSQWLSSEAMLSDEQYSVPMMQELAQGKDIPSYDLFAASILVGPTVRSDTTPQFSNESPPHLRTFHKSPPPTPGATKASCRDPSDESVAKSTAKPTSPTQANTKRRQPASIPRPPNAWILYRASKAKQMLGTGKDKGGPSTNGHMGWPETPGLSGAAHAIAKTASSETHLPFKQQQNLSKILASMWREESEENRAHWKALAEEKRIEHRLKYPEYRYGEVLDTKKKFDESVKEAMALSALAKKQGSDGKRISDEQIAKAVVSAASRELTTPRGDHELKEDVMSTVPKKISRKKRALKAPKLLRIQTESYAEEHGGDQSTSDVSSAEMVFESQSPTKELAREDSAFPPTPQTASMAGLTRALELLDKFTASPTRMECPTPTTAANSETTMAKKVIKKNAKEGQAKSSPALRTRRKSVSSQQSRRKSLSKPQSPIRRKQMTASQLEYSNMTEKDDSLQMKTGEKQRAYSLPHRIGNQADYHTGDLSETTCDFDASSDREANHPGTPSHNTLNGKRRSYGNAEQITAESAKSPPTSASNQSIFTPVRLLPLIMPSQAPLQPFVTPSELQKRIQADPHDYDSLADAGPLDVADLLEAKQCAEQLLASMDMQQELAESTSERPPAGQEDEMPKWDDYGYLTLSDFCSPSSLVNESNQQGDYASHRGLSARKDQTPSSGSNESVPTEWDFNLLNCEMDLGFIEDVDIGMFAPKEREEEGRGSNFGESSLSSNELGRSCPTILTSDPFAFLLSSLGRSDEQATSSTLERDLSDILG